MGAENIFTKAELQEVYYRIGTFPDDNKFMYKRAPFSRLTIKPNVDTAASHYLVPDFYAPTKFGGQGTMDPRWAADTLPDYPWDGIGNRSLRILVLEEHEMGNWQSDDDWKAVHRFEYL